MSVPFQPIPQGDYVPARRHGALIFTSGMTPRRDRGMDDPLQPRERRAIAEYLRAKLFTEHPLGRG